MLHHVRRIKLGAFNAPEFTEFQTSESGEVKEIKKSSAAPLPSPDTAKLENLVKGKIPVQRVKTKILKRGNLEVANQFAQMVEQEQVKQKEQINNKEGE